MCWGDCLVVKSAWVPESMAGIISVWICTINYVEIRYRAALNELSCQDTHLKYTCLSTQVLEPAFPIGNAAICVCVSVLLCDPCNLRDIIFNKGVWRCEGWERKNLSQDICLYSISVDGWLVHFLLCSSILYVHVSATVSICVHVILTLLTI